MIKIDIPDEENTLAEYASFVEGSFRKFRYFKEISENTIYTDISSKCELSSFEELFALSFNQLRAVEEKISSIWKKEYSESDRGFFTNYMKEAYRNIIDKSIHKREPLSHWLVKQMNVQVCPYCNRQYVTTIKKNSKTVRPEFDHFYPQVKNPYFALSFYNLIPSCHTCNQKKSTQSIGINPHVEAFENDFFFQIENLENCLWHKSEGWSIEFQSSLSADSKKIERCKDNVDKLFLRDLYQHHKDIVEEIIYKAKDYKVGYYKNLLSAYKIRGLSKSEIHRMIFGNYIAIEDYGKRPLSKLTADILKQLKIDN